MGGGIFEINWGALLTSFKLKTILGGFFGSETLSAQETFLEGIFWKVLRGVWHSEE
jgi:hypothetical protein